MALTETGLGSFGQLSRAIGLTTGSGTNSAWFNDPMGGPSNPHGLKHLLSDDDQRGALLDFVDEVLGPPDGRTTGGTRWVPLFHESAPSVTISAVVTDPDDGGPVAVGIGLEHSTASATPGVTTRVHVPIAEVPGSGTDTRPPAGEHPRWLLLGRAGGRVTVEVEAVFTADAPVPGAPYLRGATAVLGIPTGPDDDVYFRLDLIDLQLPGATTPQTRSLVTDGIDELGADVLEFVLGLLRAQLDTLDLDDPGLRVAAGLAGMVGLRTVTDLPALPLADLPTRGLTAVVEWVEGVLSDNDARDAWLSQLALLLHGTALPELDAVRKTIGAATITAGLRVTPSAAGGHPVLVPWVSLAYDTRAGVQAVATVDLLRADTGTGSVLAMPSARLEAVFGEDAGGARLLPGGPPGLGSVHIGVALDADGRPAFRLTLHDVTLVPGGQTHAVLDLSSPQAALDAVDNVVDAALSAALDALGDAGDLLKGLLGIDPPGGIDPIRVTDVIADPLGAVRGYWNDLLDDDDAMAEVLGALRALLTGTAAAAVPGDGTEAIPWRVEIVSGVAVLAWKAGSHLSLAVAADASTPVLAGLQVQAQARLLALDVDLATGVVAFVSRAAGRLALTPTGADPVRLGAAALSLEVSSVAVDLSWAPGRGLGVALDASGLHLVSELATAPVRYAIPLPAIGADGTLTFTPDWDEVQDALFHLLRHADSPVVTVLLDLVGWGRPTGSLRLAGLVADPAAALRAWAVDVALNCGHLRAVLAPVATLLSGWTLDAPLGQGQPALPYRCPVAGEPRAPGLVAWTVPGCQPVDISLVSGVSSRLTALVDAEAPAMGDVVTALRYAATSVPGIADLLVSRAGLGDGLDALVTRWTGSDGISGPPVTLPDGVASSVAEGMSYAELVAAGRTGFFLDLVPAGVAVVHVGVEPTWDRGVPSASYLDASAADPASTVLAAGAGPWYLRIPPASAGMAVQAARIAAALAGRTADIVLVGYGPAGAAAVQAGSESPHVSAVLTVGAPWSAVSVAGSATGLGGDAARLLDTLRPADVDRWPDQVLGLEASPYQRGLGLVARAVAVSDASDLPAVEPITRRAGMALTMVHGAMTEDQARRAIAAVVAESVRARADGVVAAPPQPVQELHLGVDVPVLEADLGGLMVGLGAAVDLVQVLRAGGAGELRTLREVLTTLRIGVTDGWIVGGPGASQRDLECRWLDVRVGIPVGVGSGSCEIVLHDARAFDAQRERWVVRADGLDGATPALPEVKVVLAEVVARVAVAAPQLMDLLAALGVVRAGGLDPDGLDRLLFDPATTVRSALDSAASDLARALRRLLGGPAEAPSAPANPLVTVGVGGSSVVLDLAGRTLTASTTLAVAGAPPLTLAVSASPTGASGSAGLGLVDPVLGGLAAEVSVATGSGAVFAIRHRAPGAATDRTVPLYPSADVEGLRTVLISVVPAALAQAVATVCRSHATGGGAAALDAALSALGLLTPWSAGQPPRVVLPVGLFTDPGAWLRHRADPASAIVALLDALAEVVAPERGAEPGWPIADILTIDYRVVDGRLELLADLHIDETIDGRPIVVHVVGGLAIGLSGPAIGPPTGVLDASVTVDGRGLRLRLAPSVTLELLRPSPAAPLRIYPDGPGLGQALGAVAESVVPMALNELASHRSDAGSSLVKDVGAAVFDLGAALALLDADQFTGARIAAFADDPAGALLARLPVLVATGLATVAHALDPAGTVVAVSTPGTDQRRFAFGAGGRVHVTLDGSAGTPAVVVGGSIPLGNPVLGQLHLVGLRLGATGIQADVRLGPVTVEAGPVTLRPLVQLRAGMGFDGLPSGSRLLAIGVATDATGTESVQVRWALDASAPVPAVVTHGVTDAVDEDIERFALAMLGIALQIASGLLAEHLRPILPAQAVTALQDVVFTGGDVEIDASFITDLLDPEALLHRLKVLAWNLAGVGLSVTIEDTVTIGLVAQGAGATKDLGLQVSIPDGKRIVLAPGETEVSLEVDARWIDPEVPAGLSILVLRGTVDSLDLVPGITVAGLGVRFRKTSGPLLNLGAISLDAIAVHLYGQATAAGVGGGARLQLDGLAVAPGGGGTNGVANALMNDAGASASPASRPSFSPSLAIQKHPNLPVGVSLRAGDPPGPWWIVIQRQLGPLYVDRIGLNTVESGGKITQISLLFSGSVSLFGLNASVDQLGITWNGGDVLSITSWSVDLMGLAVSADMAGLTLAGGLLKTVEGNAISYVGMLSAKFAVYGLSVFGGYTKDGANASFFVFGAINGPIGGPPAFFITGLGGGFGINRGLRVPDDISKFADYPFIKALGPAASAPSDPMAELAKLSVYFPHQMGNFWFAGGISFTCFSLVDGIAVIAVSIGDGLELYLLGLARMALPRPNAALVSIELALLARFSTREGVFMIKAQLTDNSWLLYEDVRLTGGFAFAVWWKGPLAGQFVLTMGGYHPSFHRDGYPDVPRLGIVWRVSDAICIKGGSYFALTSEALMAGVDVEVSVDFGWVWASIGFGAHGIVYFDPFWFEVMAYARISAGIDIDLGLFSISLSITIGAQIKVWGPEFAGEATFEIGPCDVTVGFGSQTKVAKPPLTWPQFVAKYLEDNGSGSARSLSSIAGKGSLPANTEGATAAPSSDGSADRPFEVFAEFELTFVTTVPTQWFDVGLDEEIETPIVRSDGAGSQLGLWPMQSRDLQSRLVIRLEKKGAKTFTAENVGLHRLMANLAKAAKDPAGTRLGSDAFPLGAWGPPQPLGLPVTPLPSGDIVTAGNRITVVAQVDLVPGSIEIDYYRVEAGRRRLPLQAKGPARAAFLAVSATLPPVTPATAEEALATAAQTLFGPRVVRTEDRPEGLLDRGGHSSLGAASYVRERVAPPLFGTLTDGLATANGADGKRKAAPDAPTKTAPTVRAPFVAGLLASGAGAKARGKVTTVARQDVKRRLAPSLDSVRGRLGVQLPTSLTTTAVPVRVKDGTVLTTAPAPFTDALGLAGSVVGGRIGSPGLAALVGGLNGSGGGGPRAAGRGRRSALAGPRRDAQGRFLPRADETVQPLRSGDLVVLQLPDSAIDVGSDRPELVIAGAARVVVTDGHAVVVDTELRDGAVGIPVGANLVAIHSDGDADATDGMAGWHPHTRVARLGGRSALAPGATLTVDQGDGGGLAWTTAAEMVATAGKVTTRFTRPVRTVVVLLSGDTARTLDPTELVLLGASVATDQAGTAVPPTVVSLGALTALVYDVRPDPRAAAVSVAVRVGGAWSLAGVLGGTDSVAQTADVIARRGVAAMAARLLAASGPGTTATWKAGGSR